MSREVRGSFKLKRHDNVASHNHEIDCEAVLFFDTYNRQNISSLEETYKQIWENAHHQIVAIIDMALGEAVMASLPMELEANASAEGDGFYHNISLFEGITSSKATIRSKTKIETSFSSTPEQAIALIKEDVAHLIANGIASTSLSIISKQEYHIKSSFENSKLTKFQITPKPKSMSSTH